MPVHLCKLASCETTTCSSLVKWQSNSSMSVPTSTALREQGFIRQMMGTQEHWCTFTSMKGWSTSSSPAKAAPALLHETTTGTSRLTHWPHSHTHNNPHGDVCDRTHCLNAAMVFSRFSPAPANWDILRAASSPDAIMRVSKTWRLVNDCQHHTHLMKGHNSCKY